MLSIFKKRSKHPLTITTQVQLDRQEDVALINDLTFWLEEQLGGMTPEGREKGSIRLGDDVRLLRQDVEASLKKGVLVMTWSSLSEKGAELLASIAPQLEHLKI